VLQGFEFTDVGGIETARIDPFVFATAAVPEPSTLLLATLGVLGLLWIRRRR